MKAACAPPRSRPPPSSSSHLLPSHRHRAHPAGLGTQRFGGAEIWGAGGSPARLCCLRSPQGAPQNLPGGVGRKVQVGARRRVSQQSSGEGTQDFGGQRCLVTSAPRTHSGPDPAR